MKKLSKIILFILVSASTLALTLFTSFAVAVDDITGTPYLPSQNLKNVGSALYLTDDNGLPYWYKEVSFGQPSVSYDPTTSNYSTFLSFAGSNNKPMDTKTTLTNDNGVYRLYTEILSASRASQSVSRNTPFLGSFIEVSASDFVYSPVNTQGEYRIKLDNTYLTNLGINSKEYIMTYGVNYSFTIEYPLVSGGTVPISVTYSDTVGIISWWDSDYVQTFRVSAVPCDLVTPASFQKLTATEVYSLAFANYSGTSSILNPDQLSTYPLFFSDITVTATVMLDFEDGSYEGFIPAISITFGTRATENGLPNPGESIKDFYDISARPIDFTDFEFTDWIVDLVKGIGGVELFPNFYLLYPIVGSVALALIIWILKVFLGG